jgi:LacI family transcriptional regulator, galactose operon repressor
VLVCTTGGDAGREAAFLQTVRAHHFDGVVLAGSGANAELVNDLLDGGRAVVTMNREVPGSRAPSVLSAYEDAARLATDHLLDLGHTRIAAIEGPPEVTSGRLQDAGFRMAMAGRGVGIAGGLVHRGPFTYDFGRAAATALLALPDPPTALVISNPEASFGVLPVLAAHDVAVPGQLSVICTEDETVYQWWSPPLTVVDTRAEQLAQRTGALLLAQLNGARAGRPAYRAEPVEPVLLERASTAPLR